MKKEEEDQYIELGHCRKAHGLKGAFTLNLFNFETNLKKGDKLHLLPITETSSISPDGQDFIISEINTKGKFILYLKGIDNRNDVDLVLPFSINVKRSTLPQLEDDEFYINDFVGAKVFSFENKEPLGEIINFYEIPGQYVFVIKGKTEFEVPFIDNFVKTIDLENNRVEIIEPTYYGSDSE
jgi:16S rRNA processing protein RimM